MLTHSKNIRPSKNSLLKLMCLTILMLGGALQAMDVPNPNEQLWGAAEVGNLDEVRQLLRNGADVNAKDQANGWTALMVAAKNEHFDVCKFLIEKGAHINAKDQYFATPLGIAKDYEICKLLIDNGANVNATDDLGTTILIAATMLGSLEKCKLLIENGADVNVIDQWGSTPLKAAIRRGEHRSYDPIETEKLCKLIIDALLKAPMNQALLKSIHLTPEQRSEINALVASLKNTPIKGLHRDTKRLIIEDVRNTFKRRNFITEQIATANDPLRQELLDYLKSRTMSQYPNARGITWDEAFGTFE